LISVSSPRAMRFSCTIADQGSVENVTRYLRTMAAICHHKIGMKIGPDAIALHSAETVKNGGHSLTLKFDTSCAFSTYVSNHSPCLLQCLSLDAFLPFSEDVPFIMLEVEIRKLTDIFHASKGHVRWKLFNKAAGNDTLGVKKPHFLVQMRENHVSHHIPVTVVTEKRWEAYERQQQPLGKVIHMPSARSIYKTLQQFKQSQARFVIFQCDQEGKFSLGAQLEQAKTVVFFPDCMVDVSASTEIDPFRTKLNLRSLNTFFGGLLSAPHCTCTLNVTSERTAEIQVQMYESELSFVIGSVVNE
ncbi:hypothetical protein PENTCL1PPCAC_10402, partial [Pristionchus entomophagus]